MGRVLSVWWVIWLIRVLVSGCVGCCGICRLSSGEIVGAVFLLFLAFLVVFEYSGPSGGVRVRGKPREGPFLGFSVGGGGATWQRSVL